MLGGRVIWDLEGLTMAHYWQMSTTVVQKVLELLGVSDEVAFLGAGYDRTSSLGAGGRVPRDLCFGFFFK